MNREELKGHVRKSLDRATFQEATKLSVPYVILIRGKRIKLNSKDVWTKIGSAKSALRLWLNGLFRFYQSKSKINIGDCESPRSTIKEAQDEWINHNVVFVPISDYINSLKKAGKIK